MFLNKTVFFEEDKLTICSHIDQSEKEIPLSEDVNIGKNYILVVPDWFVYLIASDITRLRRGKGKEMLKLFLSDKYPEKVIRGSAGYIKTSPLIGFIYSDKLKHYFNKYHKLFDSARIITTPSLVVLTVEDGDFILRSDRTTLLKHNGSFLHIIGETESYSFPEGLKELMYNRGQILELIRTLVIDKKIKKSNLNLLETVDNESAISAIKKDLVIFGVIYIVFSLSLFLKYMPIKEEIKNYKDSIDTMYKASDLSKSSDPYGMLLYKIRSLKTQISDKSLPLKILYGVSTSFDQDTYIENLYIDHKLIKIKGRTNELQALDRASKNLLKFTGLTFVVDNADVQNGGVYFTLTARSKK